MNTPNKVSFFKSITKLTGLLVAIVASLILCVYALMVYSSLSLTTDGAAIGILSEEQKYLDKMHVAAHKYLLSPAQPNLDEYQRASELFEQRFKLLLDGGDYKSADMTSTLVSAEGVFRTHLQEIGQKFKVYDQHIKVALQDQSVQEEPLTGRSEGALLAIEEASAQKKEIEKILDEANIAFTTVFMEKQLIVQLGILCAVILCLSVFAYTYFAIIRKRILKPLQEIVLVSDRLSTGDLSVQVKDYTTIELGKLSRSLNEVIEKNKDSASFALGVGRKNFSVELSRTGEKDELGKALVKMRNDLKKVEEEEKKRHWTTEGYTRVSEIIRQHNQQLEVLAHEVLLNLIKYLKANQGALYIVDDSNDKEVILRMKACYAWNRKKYIDREISKGEGLAGQAWQENDTIYLTEVPDNYVSITSGLGEANPTSILIVPLKVNDEILGVVEIASFHKLLDYEIEFVEKAAESIASAISSVKITERTKQLLEKSQQQTEEMRAQEEEMRQNMEELEATQEEMNRQEVEIRGKLTAVDNTLAFVEFDLQGYVLNANQNFVKTMGYSLEEIKGNHHRMFCEQNYAGSEAYNEFWRNLNTGIVIHDQFKRIGKNGKEVWLRASYTPVSDKHGRPVKIIKFAFDVTEDKLLTEALQRNLEGLNVVHAQA